MKKHIFGALIALSCLFLLASPLQAQQSRLDSIKADGVLRVGTPGNWKPMSFRDPASNQYVGFDVDLVTKLAEDMGVKVEFVPTDWKSIAIAVADKYDISTSASLSPARALVAGYTNPYFRVADVPLVSQQNGDKFKDWDDLNQSRGDDCGNARHRSGTTRCSTLSQCDHSQDRRACSRLARGYLRPSRCFHDEQYRSRQLGFTVS